MRCSCCETRVIAATYSGHSRKLEPMAGNDGSNLRVSEGGLKEAKSKLARRLVNESDVPGSRSSL